MSFTLTPAPMSLTVSRVKRRWSLAASEAAMWGALDLVEDDQLVDVLAEIELRLGELRLHLDQERVAVALAPRAGRLAATSESAAAAR